MLGQSYSTIQDSLESTMVPMCTLGEVLGLSAGQALPVAFIVLFICYKKCFLLSPLSAGGECLPKITEGFSNIATSGMVYP